MTFTQAVKAMLKGKTVELTFGADEMVTRHVLFLYEGNIQHIANPKDCLDKFQLDSGSWLNYALFLSNDWEISKQTIIPHVDSMFLEYSIEELD